MDQGSCKLSWGEVIFKAAFLRTMGPLFVKLQIPPLVPTRLLEFEEQKITSISGLQIIKISIGNIINDYLITTYTPIILVLHNLVPPIAFQPISVVGK